MDALLLIAGATLASYLLGGIPFGYLLGQLVAGIDIRSAGSGNIGATNAGRVLGWHWFFVVFFLDFLKGIVPTVATAMLLAGSLAAGWQPTTLIILSGAAALLGHLYPVYLRFSGGKGMATGLGVVAALGLYLSWWPPLAGLVVFLMTVGITRYISLGSLLATVTYSVVQLVCIGDIFSANNAVATAFSILAPLLVVWRHRTNIARLLSGTESQVGQSHSQQPSGGSAQQELTPQESTGQQPTGQQSTGQQPTGQQSA